eukprot:9648595-Lingulodinium_polyedra.AAC.1
MGRSLSLPTFASATPRSRPVLKVALNAGMSLCSLLPLATGCFAVHQRLVGRSLSLADLTARSPPSLLGLSLYSRRWLLFAFGTYGFVRLPWTCSALRPCGASSLSWSLLTSETPDHEAVQQASAL